MKILSLAVFGYALYQYLDAKRNLDNTTKSVIQNKIDEAQNKIDTYIEDKENYKDDLLQAEQKLDASSMTAYSNPDGITIKPTYNYDPYHNDNEFDLSIYSTRNGELLIRDIIATLYVKVRPEDILEATMNKDGSYTLKIKRDSPSYDGEPVYQKGKVKSKKNILYYEVTASRYQNDYYVMLDYSNFESKKEYTLLPYTETNIIVPLFQIAHRPGEIPKYVLSDRERVAEDKGRIESAWGREITEVGGGYTDDVVFVDIQLDYKQQTNYTGTPYWAQTLFVKLPVRFRTGLLK